MKNSSKAIFLSNWFILGFWFIWGFFLTLFIYNVSNATICKPTVTNIQQVVNLDLLALIVIGWRGFFPACFPTFCLLLLVASEGSFYPDSNENNNNGENSITSISLSVITLFHPFPFLLKLYLTSSAVVHKQDYWYLSEMKVHF